jgi:hypothetical protein
MNNKAGHKTKSRLFVCPRRRSGDAIRSLLHPTGIHPEQAQHVSLMA